MKTGHFLINSDCAELTERDEEQELLVMTIGDPHTAVTAQVIKRIAKVKRCIGGLREVLPRENEGWSYSARFYNPTTDTCCFEHLPSLGTRLIVKGRHTRRGRRGSISVASRDAR